ncbi:hypothetical protein QEN19_003614 [Hanseniaspora menglaensis]
MLNRKKVMENFSFQDTNNTDSGEDHSNMMDLLKKDMEKKHETQKSESSLELDENYGFSDDFKDIDRDLHGENLPVDGAVIILSDDESGRNNNKIISNNPHSYKYDIALKRKRSMDIARKSFKKNKDMKNTRYDALSDIPNGIKVLKSGSWLDTATGQLVSRKIYRATGVITNQNDINAQDLHVLKEIYHHDSNNDNMERFKSTFLNDSNKDISEENDNENGIENILASAVAKDPVSDFSNYNSNSNAPESLSQKEVNQLSDGSVVVTKTYNNNSTAVGASVGSSLTLKENMYINLSTAKKREIQKNRLLKIDKVNKKKVLGEYILKNDHDIEDIASVSRRATDSILLDQVDNNGVESNLIQVFENGSLHISEDTPDRNQQVSAPPIDLDALPDAYDDDLEITDVRTSRVTTLQTSIPIAANNTVMLETERRLRDMASRMNARRTEKLISEPNLNLDEVETLKEVLKEIENYPPHIRSLFDNSSGTKSFQAELKKYLPSGATDKLNKLGKLYFKFRALRGCSQFNTLVKRNNRRQLRSSSPHYGFGENRMNNFTNIRELLMGNHHILRHHNQELNSLFENNEDQFMERMMGQIEEMEGRQTDERDKKTTEKRKGMLEKFMAKINKLPYDHSCDFTEIPKKLHLEIGQKEQQLEDVNSESDDETKLQLDDNKNHSISSTKAKNLSSSKDIFEVKKTFITDETSAFKKLNVCFLCATPLRLGIPSEFKGSRHKDQSFDYLVKKYGVSCPYVSLTAPTETDRQYSKRIFIALPCGHAYCGRCVMRISNSIKLPPKLKERRKTAIGCGNPYIYGPDRCVVNGCRSRFNKPNSFRELYL